MYAINESLLNLQKINIEGTKAIIKKSNTNDLLDRLDLTNNYLEAIAETGLDGAC